MNTSSILRSRILIACSATLAWLVVDASAAKLTKSMKEYRFPIGEYELSFSVPKAFMSDYLGGPAEKGAETIKGRPGEGTTVIYFRQIHMFTGPIWVGNYAAMDFAIAICDADTAYASPVSSLEQLEDYQKWQLALPNSYERYDFSRKTFAGDTWLLMTLVRVDTSPEKRRDDENTIFCLPLGNRRFLQVVCRISEEVPNKTGRWLADAHKMRDQILSSVVLRKNQVNATGQPRHSEDQRAKD